jgi:hypothetical protein
MNLKPDEFWHLTYAEFCEIVTGYVKRSRKRTNELIFAAWNVERFHRERGAIPLASVLIDEEPNTKPKEMTDDQMLAMARILNAAYGGDVVEVCDG